MWLPSQLPRKLEACERDVRAEKAEVRASAVTDLVRHTPDEGTRGRALELIAAALADPAPKVRAAAAVALADARGGEAHVEALLKAVDDDDDEVRQLAMSTLGELGEAAAALDAVVGRLLRAAEDELPSMRYQATIALARIPAGDEVRVKTLLRASSDDDFNIRYIAMRLSEEHFAGAEAPAVPERLRIRAAALLDDEQPDVAIAAALFLGHAGDERAKPIIRRVVRGEVPAQREDEREAVEIAGTLEMHDLVPDLERRAFGLTRHLRDTCAFHATIALARLGHERAVRSIRQDLRSSSSRRREAAEVAASRAKL
jgi:HEAT repeat protein